VFTAITFQSNTASAFATADNNTADNNRAAINVHSPRILFFVPPFILFIVFLLIPHWLSVSVARILAAAGVVVHIGECVAALCFVSL
jgi:hypothetical protein